jgi:hypothetical protein
MGAAPATKHHRFRRKGWQALQQQSWRIRAENRWCQMHEGFDPAAQRESTERQLKEKTASSAEGVL